MKDTTNSIPVIFGPEKLILVYEVGGGQSRVTRRSPVVRARDDRCLAFWILSCLILLNRYVMGSNLCTRT